MNYPELVAMLVSLYVCVPVYNLWRVMVRCGVVQCPKEGTNRHTYTHLVKLAANRTARASGVSIVIIARIHSRTLGDFATMATLATLCQIHAATRGQLNFIRQGGLTCVCVCVPYIPTDTLVASLL